MNKKFLLEAEAKDNAATEYRFSVEFYIFQDEGSYVAYCPALDISTCADTYNDAVSAFYEMLQLHIECCVESGTLHDDLLAHGWKFTKKNILPPSFYALMKKPEMKRLMGSDRSFERIVTPARMPAFA